MDIKLLCLSVFICALFIVLVYDFARQRRRENPELKKLIKEQNVDKIIQLVTNGTHLTARNVDRICKMPLGSRKILLAYVESGQRLSRYAQWTILSLPEEISTEIFFKYAEKGQSIEFNIVIEVCRNFSKGNAKKICYELSKHGKFFHQYCPDVQKVVPELCSDA